MRAAITVMGLPRATEAICDDPECFNCAHFHRGFNRDLIDFFAETLTPYSS